MEVVAMYCWPDFVPGHFDFLNCHKRLMSHDSAVECFGVALLVAIDWPSMVNLSSKMLENHHSMSHCHFRYLHYRHWRHSAHCVLSGRRMRIPDEVHIHRLLLTSCWCAWKQQDVIIKRWRSEKKEKNKRESEIMVRWVESEREEEEEAREQEIFSVAYKN